MGAGKALALQRRLRAINDRLEVVVDQGFTSIIASGDLPDCDVLIDATINNSVGAAIEAVWATSRKRPLIARLCTDRATSTLGLMTVSRPGSGPGLDDLDERAGKMVQNDAELEPFRCFWEEPGHGDEIVPEPGCSVPTFHGSAADLAAIAGVLTSLLGVTLASTSPEHIWWGYPMGPAPPSPIAGSRKRPSPLQAAPALREHLFAISDDSVTRRLERGCQKDVKREIQRT